MSRAGLYAVVSEAVFETRLKDMLRQATLRMVLSAVALELYLRHQRTITREVLLRLLAEIRTRQAENWNTEDVARDMINSGIVETVAKATYGYWHASYHEYFAAVELAGSLVRREAEKWELLRQKQTFSRWTEVLRLVVGVLVSEYRAEGTGVALDWLRELAELRNTPGGDPGDLGLALVLNSLGEIGDRTTLWTNSDWVQLEEAVATSWVQALFDASLHDQVVRQKRLLHMAQDLRHLCPSARALVIEQLAGDTFSRKRGTYAAALQAFGKLGRHAPVDRLLHALGNKYQSIRQPAVQALAELDGLVPREVLVSVLESESHVARAAAAQVVGEIGYRELKDYLVLSLDDEHQGVREACVEALGNMAEQAPVNRLTGCLYDKAALVRLAAVKALGKFRDRVPAQVLHPVLADPDDLVRATAIEILDVETPTHTLIKEIQHPEPPFFLAYAAAEEVLAKLDEQTFSGILRDLGNKGLRASLISLRESREEPSLEDLVRALYSNDRRRCVTAAQGLANRREWAPLEEFVTSTKYRPSFIRPLAVRLVGKFEDDASIEQLLRALSDGDLRVQFAALRALQDMEDPLPTGAVAAVACIGQKSKAIRRTALQVLARVAERVPMDVTFLEALVLAVTDEDWSVRSAAKLCLERVQERVSPELMAVLFTHKKAAIRRAALPIFGSAARVEHLIQATKDRDPETRLEAIRALSYHGEEVPRDLLLRVSRDKDSQVRHAAQMMLKRLTRHQRQSDTDDESTMPVKVDTRRSAYQEWKLVAALCTGWQDTFPDLIEAVVPPEYLATWDPRLLSTGALSAAGGQTILVPTSDEDGYLDPLTRAGRDLTEKITDEGLQVLKQCAPVGGLLAVLDDDSGELRRIAVQALEERTPEDRLILALDDEDCQVRRAAIQVLRERMPTQELMAALNDEYDIVREAALEVVRTQGAGLPEALLVEALEHPNGSMRASAIRALAVRTPAEKVFPALGDSDEEVRLAAAEALRLAHPQIWQRAISEVMAVVTSPGSSTILDSAAYCFTSDLIGSLEQASPVLLETVSQLLTQSYWEVQVRAAQALGQLRRSIPDSALRRLYTLRSDAASKTVRRAAEDALAEILSLQVGIEDEGYESVELSSSAGE